MSRCYLYVVPGKPKLLTVRVAPTVLLEFQAACALRGATMSSFVHQYVVKTIREEKERDAEAFNEAVKKAQSESKLDVVPVYDMDLTDEKTKKKKSA